MINLAYGSSPVSTCAVRDTRWYYSTAGVTDTGSPLPLADAVAVLDHVGELELPGRTWTLRYRAAPGFSPATDRLAPWLIVISGLFAAILFHVMSRAGARLSSARAWA